MEEYSKSSVKKAKLQSMLNALLEDPILADVPKRPSLADVDTLINLELGSAMRINVLKLDGTSFGNTYLSSYTMVFLKAFLICLFTLSPCKMNGEMERFNAHLVSIF